MSAFSVEKTEAKAILLAIQTAWDHGWRKVVIELDCEAVIEAINGPTDPFH